MLKNHPRYNIYLMKTVHKMVKGMLGDPELPSVGTHMHSKLLYTILMQNV